MRPLLIVMSAAIVVLAQQGGGDALPAPASLVSTRAASANAAQVCAVEGRVRNAVTGEPVKNARLLLRPTGASPNVSRSQTSYRASTEEDGHFVLNNIEPGSYRLSAESVGFVSTEYGSRDRMGVGTILSLYAGERLQDVMFRLTPHAVIAGHVLNEQGEPIPLVQVQAMHYRYSMGRKLLSSFGGAATNDLGEYRIFGLPPGRYYLRATYRSNAISDAVVEYSASRTSDDDYVPTYYPRATEPAAATAIEAPAGAQLRGIDFLLSKSRTVHISGQVNNANGKGIITVMLAPADPAMDLSLNRTYLTDPQGLFDIRGVVPGLYAFVASALDATGSLTARQAVDLNDSLENFNLTIPPALELLGHVLVEGAQRPSLSDVHVSLRPRERTPIFGPLPNTRVKEDGTFSLSNISPDSYDLIAFDLPDGYYVKSLKMRDQDVLDAGVNLSRESVGPVSITLARGAGQAEGAVLTTQGQPAPGVTVTLIPQDERRRDQLRLYRSTTTDQQGRFRLNSVNPGRYKLFAWEDIEDGAYMDPEFVKPVEDRGVLVTIVENSDERFQLRLILAAGAQQEESGPSTAKR